MKEHNKDLLLSIGFTLLIIGVVAAACAIDYIFFGPEEGDELMGDRFILIEDLGDSYVAADKETGVLYMITNDDGITVLLDSDGKPMLYKGKLP